MQLRNLIINKDLAGLRQLLSDNPALANEAIPYDEKNSATAHPLHRICDGVMCGRYTDEDAVDMARIFLENGAIVDGYALIPNRDHPLVAAASLHAEKTGILYIENGATINHPGCHGGTALHWAAWTGRDQLVNELIIRGAEINRRCTDFKSTPLLWAVHGYRFGGMENRLNQLACARILLDHGADKTIPNTDGYSPIELLQEEDAEFIELLR